jgi:hypothetical protein
MSIKLCRRSEVDIEGSERGLNSMVVMHVVVD